MAYRCEVHSLRSTTGIAVSLIRGVGRNNQRLLLQSQGELRQQLDFCSAMFETLTRTPWD
jgi:hypothetical protein